MTTINLINVYKTLDTLIYKCMANSHVQMLPVTLTTGNINVKPY